MAERNLPGKNHEFATKIRVIADAIARDPAAVQMSRAESDRLTSLATRYAEARQAANLAGGGNKGLNNAKDELRREIEPVFRRVIRRVGATEGVPTSVLVALGINSEKPRARHQGCPEEPPRLRFIRALHEGNGAMPKHELRFEVAGTLKSTRPKGAARVELFVDLVPPDEAIPPRPGMGLGGWPLYLRSYTKNPILVAPPIARVPMRVVYWARWADSVGNVGEFSATCVAWIEGGSQRMLPGGLGMGATWNKEISEVEINSPTGPAHRDPTYRVAVREVQFEYFNGNTGNHTPTLPAPEQPQQRQLEGPEQRDAA